MIARATIGRFRKVAESTNRTDRHMTYRYSNWDPSRTSHTNPAAFTMALLFSRCTRFLLVCIFLKEGQVRGFQPVVRRTCPSKSIASFSRRALQSHSSSLLTRTVPRRRSLLSSLDTTGDSGDSGNVLIVDPLILDVSKSLQRVSFFSWWAQVILSTISAVILGFAKNVMSTSASRSASPGLLLSGPGLILSACSILWTWGNGSRLSRRLVSKPTSRSEGGTLLRRAIRVGATLNMIGLLFNLIAANQIVGGLAIKVLTQQANAATWSAGLQGLQPLDILVVQANTNSLLSHFLSLASLLFMTEKLHLLRGSSNDREQRR